MNIVRAAGAGTCEKSPLSEAHCNSIAGDARRVEPPVDKQAAMEADGEAGPRGPLRRDPYTGNPGGATNATRGAGGRRVGGEVR